MKPYEPPALTKAEVHAIKTLAEGGADAGLQKMALNVILDRFCQTHDLSYRPDQLGGDRDTAFAEGKRFVGLMIRRVITQPMTSLVKEEPDEPRTNRVVTATERLANTAARQSRR